MNIDKKVLNRIALVLAAACVGLNLVTMIVPFRTYGVDSFLLSGVMLLMAYNFKSDDRMRTYSIICLVVAIVGIATGVMNLMGL